MSAALSAVAADAHDIANPATAPTHATVLISLMVSLPFTAIARRRSPCYALAGRQRPARDSCSAAEAAAKGVEPRLEARLVQDGAVDDAARQPAMLDVEHG